MIEGRLRNGSGPGRGPNQGQLESLSVDVT